MADSKTIYVVREWRKCDGEDVLDVGMITTDKSKADDFASKKQMPVLEIEDGFEWPSF